MVSVFAALKPPKVRISDVCVFFLNEMVVRNNRKRAHLFPHWFILAFPKGTAGNKRITDVVGLCKLQPSYPIR